MKQKIDKALVALDIHPVLVDIGASGAPPQIWEPIAHCATYVGFDPDRRELRDIPDGQFARSIIVNEAVTSVSGQDEAHFYLTHSPYCSSTLHPNTKSLDNYLFADLFAVEGEASVPASTMSAVLNRLSLSGIDWFKTDSQGTDLRLFKSLPNEARSRILAVDIEPGLTDFYVGEDVFVDSHAYLTQNGFWLSNLNVCGTVRMSRSTLAVVNGHGIPLDERLAQRTVRKSPGWCEARYFRSIDWLAKSNFSKREYVLLWVFALMDGQLGFALDVGVAYGQTFGPDKMSQFMETEPVTLMKRIHRKHHIFRQFRKIWNHIPILFPKRTF